jgi:hypothetical protein
VRERKEEGKKEAELERGRRDDWAFIYPVYLASVPFEQRNPIRSSMNHASVSAAITRGSQPATQRAPGTAEQNLAPAIQEEEEVQPCPGKRAGSATAATAAAAGAGPRSRADLC